MKLIHSFTNVFGLFLIFRFTYFESLCVPENSFANCFVKRMDREKTKTIKNNV